MAVLLWNKSRVAAGGEQAYTGLIAAQSSVVSSVSMEAVPPAVIACHATVESAIEFTSELVVVGDIATQSGLASTYAFVPSGNFELEAGPGITRTTSTVEFTFTGVAKPETGGGGFAWPLPQRVKRVRPRPRVPTLVHRVYAVRGTRLDVRGSSVSMRYRAALVARPVSVPVLGAAVRATRLRLVLARPTAQRSAQRATLTIRRMVLAGPDQTVTRGRTDARYRSTVMAGTGRLSLIGSSLTSDKSIHPMYATMFADDEWLLMEVA